MARTASIVAPPYHVQSTAAELRSGFPYFSYHESVSKLWAEKWRTPCQRGIYPFTDGNLGDFNPIFGELVKVSDGPSEILSRPDEYAKPFFPVAENLVTIAGQAEAQGDSATARDLYLRAAAVYRIARFPINRSKVSRKAWEKGKEAYVKAGQYLNPPSVAVDVPFTHRDLPAGDTGVAIQANFRIPQGTKPTAGLFSCSSAVLMPTRPITLHAPRSMLIGVSQR
jgi:hypothetical protein